MASYRRFVAYVYRYRNNRKGDNCGFIKVEARNGLCTFFLRMQGIDIPGMAQIFVFVRKEIGADFLLLGQTEVKNGVLHQRIDSDRLHMGGSGYTLEQCGGMIILGDEGTYYGTVWDDQDEIPVWKKDIAKPKIQGEEGKKSDPTGNFGATDENETVIPVKSNGESELVTHMNFADNTESASLMDSPGQTESPKQMESPGQMEPATQTKSQDKIEQIIEIESWNKSESSIPMKPQDERESITETDSRNKPDLTMQMKAQEEGESIRETDSRNRPELTMKMKAQGETESTIEKDGQNKSEPAMQIEPQDRTKSIMQAKSKNETESAMQTQAQKQTESVIQTESRDQTRSVTQMKTSNESRPEKTETGKVVRQETENSAETEEKKESEKKNPPELETQEQKKQPPFREMWEHMQKEYMRLEPFEDGGVVEGIKIAPSDIPYLQERNWNLGNNRFLLHGYKNYRHLLLGRLEGQNCYVLGVPGIYDQQEQFMAKLFGFPQFKPVRQCKRRMGQFGYWLRCIS